MKAKTLGFILILLSNINFAQNTLKGNVQNEQGVPLSNAHVYLMVKACANSLSIDPKSDKKTDANGTFDMLYIASEEPILYVEAAGYERKKVKITGEAVTIKLTPLNQSTVKTDKNEEVISVSGMCGMCKKRIESAVYSLTGVKKAVWSIEEHTLLVSFDASKTSLDAIKQKITTVGHDAPPFKADEVIYKKLPACCKYRDNSKIMCTMK
ncbi:MAG: cation transporter [Saprospiraceae bacterium]|nr:cation transporter [Saprospiraceae bacterium]